MHTCRLFREIIEHVGTSTQSHPDSLRLQQTSFMGGFLLACVGEPRASTASERTTGVVELGDPVAAISAVRAFRTDKPRPITTKSTWRPCNRELLLHTGPVLTVPATSVFQGYAMSFRLDIDRCHALAVLPPSP